MLVLVLLFEVYEKGSNKALNKDKSFWIHMHHWLQLNIQILSPELSG